MTENEWTPTVKQAREAYAYVEFDAAETGRREAQFNRMLAAHDAQVKADALEGFTTETATIPEFIKDDTVYPPSVFQRPRGHYAFKAKQRLVGPWVEVRGTGTPTGEGK